MSRLKILLGLLFFAFSRPCFAKIYINEVSPLSSPEWVEFYNPNNESLDNYSIDDDLDFGSDVGNSKIKPLSELKGGNLYPYFDGLNNFLNDGGDYVVLFKPNGEKEDEYQYGSPGRDKPYFGRIPDGGSWEPLATSSQGQPNPTPTPTPTNSPTPTASPTPSLTPTSPPTPSLTPIPTNTKTPTAVQNKATYEIRDAKDQDGNILSGVKIYVDDVYLGHYAPETLTFCDGCRCDNLVDCGFGDHKIKATKSGYEDWIDEVEIEENGNYEGFPVLIKITESIPTSVFTATPRPTSTPKPTSTTKPTPTNSVTLTPTPTGQVLGEEEEATESNKYFFSLSSTSSGEASPAAEKKNNLTKIIAFFLIVSGGGLIGGALLLGKKKNEEDQADFAD